MMKPIFLLGSAFSLLVVGQHTSAWGKALEVDSDTMLLASFDEGVYKADYAAGWDQFVGSGVERVPGYYGEAIDLTRRAPRDSSLEGVTFWGFTPRGNVRSEEGTLEFWFSVGAKGAMPQLNGTRALFFSSFQPIRPQIEASTGDETPPVPKVRAFQPFLDISPERISYLFVTLNGTPLRGNVDLRRVEGYGRSMTPQEWHHFSMTWCDGEFAIYLDGRKIASHAIPGENGLSLVAQAHRPLAMSGIVLDELRSSSVVRYTQEFEPNWRDGERPGYAFNGVVKLDEAPPTRHRRIDAPIPSRAPGLAEAPLDWKSPIGVMEFDRATGALSRVGLDAPGQSVGNASRFGEGLHLYRGIDREAIALRAVERPALKDGGVSFRQADAAGLEILHALSDYKGGVRWKVQIANKGKGEEHLEVLLGVPLPWADTAEFFDGSWIQQKLFMPRRRDEYVSTLPFAAASNGNGSLGVGINPGTSLSNIISEWLPVSRTIRQGTRVVLKPGENRELEFVLVGRGGNEGALAAVEAYHNLFGEFYRLDPKVPIYSYMPVAQHFDYVNIPDMGRMFYVGSQWGHGPYHTKGDYLGTEKYWKNPKLESDPSYRHAMGAERRYDTIENLRKTIVAKSFDSFNNFYTLRRSHDVPNLTATFIVKDLLPGFDPKDDPLVGGQYYLPNFTLVNEYGTPFGKSFTEQHLELIRMIGKWSPGLINDMCHTSPYRFTDEAGQNSPARGFSRDRGVYTVAAAGHVERYKAINAMETEGGFKQSIWSDGGMVSYMLGAYSSCFAQEAGERFTGPESLRNTFQVQRYLLGEKPQVLLVSYGADNIGVFHEPGEFTPASLRQYYRENLRRMMFLALQTGMYLDPPYLASHQWMVEYNPILMESLIRGRRLLPNAQVTQPHWVVRGGHEWDSLWCVANESSSEESALLQLAADEAGVVLVDYFGAPLKQQTKEDGTTVSLGMVEARGIRGCKIVARLRGKGGAAVPSASFVSSMKGDALDMVLHLEGELAEKGTLELAPFEREYRLVNVEVDGKEVAADAPLELGAGKHVVKAAYRHRSAASQFSAADWAGVELLREGATNFCVAANGDSAFETGTAKQLSYFVAQYDEEYGIVGTLKEPVIYSNPGAVPAGYGGWKVLLEEQGDGVEAGLHLEPSTKTLRVVGKSAGERRRHMMILMRLVDRKYPHLGRSYPLRRDVSKVWEAETIKGLGPDAVTPMPAQTWKRFFKYKETKAFYEQFEDKQFLDKPILEPEYESLYEGGRVEFAGAYKLRVSPWIFEPTYDSNYVYGTD